MSSGLKYRGGAPKAGVYENRTGKTTFNITQNINTLRNANCNGKSTVLCYRFMVNKDY